VNKEELEKAIMEYTDLLAKKEYNEAQKLAKELKKTPEGAKLFSFMGMLEESAHQLDKEFNEMLVDVREYGREIKKNGWKAGEPMIVDGMKKGGPDFKKWTSAIAIMLRTVELLEEDGKTRKKE